MPDTSHQSQMTLQAQPQPPTEPSSYAMTVREARALFNTRIDDGVCCPVCQRHAKIYRRKILSQMAWALMTVYREAQCEWVHLPSIQPSVMGNGGSFAKLRYWQLIESGPDRHAGIWRITELGEAFIQRQVVVPKYVQTYDGQNLGYSGSDTVSIDDALGTRFVYDELMRGI